MSHKSQDAYEDVFYFIRTNIVVKVGGLSWNLNCAKFTTDYEVAMRNALSKTFPKATGTACWFHFTQAVKRNASQIGGFMDYVKNEPTCEAKQIYYKLLCLPLLPAKDIKPTFKILNSLAFSLNKRKFVKFITYYNRQWIEKEGPTSISVFGEQIRTTASVEAYNKQLGELIAKHGGFYRFVLAFPGRPGTR